MDNEFQTALFRTCVHACQEMSSGGQPWPVYLCTGQYISSLILSKIGRHVHCAAPLFVTQRLRLASLAHLSKLSRKPVRAAWSAQGAQQGPYPSAGVDSTLAPVGTHRVRRVGATLCQRGPGAIGLMMVLPEP